ncbi:kinase-regulated stress-responsive transcription factor skn7, partial [Tulasnella sp. 408]
RLARELKVWAGLQHPHILPLHGFYLASDYKSAVLISEYMGCGNLHDHIEIRKPPFDERLRLVRDLTDGLVYLHSQHAPIRHGDLKPETGTESLSNDMWSWGCLVSEALTGTIPFAEIRSDPRLVLALSTGTSPYTAGNLSPCPQQLGYLLAKCWSHQPEERPTAVVCLDVVESTLLGGRASPSLSAMERSVLARHESMQRLEELKRAREVRNALAAARLQPVTSPAPTDLSLLPRGLAAAGPVAVLSRAIPTGQTVAKIDSRTSLPSRVTASGQVIVAQPEDEMTATGTVVPQPATEETHPAKQGATIQEVSSEAGPSNSVPAASVDSGVAVNLTDRTGPLGPPGSRLWTHKGTFTPAWVVPPRVLLVDDDQVNRRIFSKFLQVLGCSFDVAVDGIGAVNKVAQLEKYDLILMDIIMPKLDGFSATSLIRQLDHLSPIIAMTSNDEPNDATTYYSNGMNDILSKPFTRDSLFTMLQKHLLHLKAIETAGPAAEEPSKAISRDQDSATLNVLGMRADRTSNGLPLAPIVGPSNAVTSLPRSEKRALEAVDDDREGKRPRAEVVE